MSGMAERIVYVGGEFVPESEARISILDHALLYGDGVFETVSVWNGRIFKLDEHIDRCFRSMAAIALPSPVPREEMRRLIIETVRRNGYEHAYVKWLVTRGVNGRPLMDPTGCVANLVILVQPYIERASPERTAKGLRLKTVAVRRPSGQVLDPQIKSLNYLNLVMAKIEAKAAGADEALLLNQEGRVCEATGCNIFMLHGQSLRTPGKSVLEGITRATVIDIAPKYGLSVHVGEFELYDVYTADEIIICSTAGGLLPVTWVDGRTIGNGLPGPCYASLASAYREAIAEPKFGSPVAFAAHPAA